MASIVIIPTYNERENIQRIIPEILTLNLDLDLLVVDDNSPDGTNAVVKELKLKIKDQKTKIFVLDRKKKEGLGRAYITGFKWAIEQGYDIIIQMDADFSHHPKYLVKMLKEIKNHNLIIGSRYVKGGGLEGWNLWRRILSRGGSLYAKFILGVPVNDLTAGFKCWRASLLKKIDLGTISSEGYCFQIEMTYRAWKNGAKIKEIPITFVDRCLGRSKMSKKIIWEAFWKVWQLRFIPPK